MTVPLTEPSNDSRRLIYALNILPLGEVGKATICFKWQARVLYGVKISEKTPITWKRVIGQPGVIEISSPELEVIETSINLAKDKFIAQEIKKGAGVNEDAKKLEFLARIKEISEADSQEGLKSDYLRDIAVKIISHHIISLINQGAAGNDKVHTARVEFRKS